MHDQSADDGAGNVIAGGRKSILNKNLKNMISMKSFLILINILLIIGVFSGCIEKTPKPNVTFESILNITVDFENPYEAAKSVLEKKYGENWYTSYQLGGTLRYPSIPFEHILMQIPSQNPPYFNPNFTLLFTNDTVYILSPQDFNKFLEIYGSSIKMGKNETLLQLIDSYLFLYGARDERRSVDPKKLNIVKEEPYYKVQFYTSFLIPTYPNRIPSPQDLIVNEYGAKIGTKGEVFLNLINRTEYKQFYPAGPR